MELRLIVAVAENGVIGADGALPWHLRADLQRFKRLTMGQTLIMGRKTFDSIGRALPGRTSIVLTRDAAFAAPRGVIVVGSFDEALAAVPSEIGWVIGGASMFEEVLARADDLPLTEIHLTRVHAAVEGDVHFPEWPESEWVARAAERTERDEDNDHQTTYMFLVRKVRSEAGGGSSGVPK